MRRSIKLAASVLGCVLLLSTLVEAGELKPGTYYGYVNKDRWGRYVYHHGDDHLFLSKRAAKRLKPYNGKPLQVEVTEVSQTYPMGGMIMAVGKVSVKGVSSGLTLSASIGKAKVRQGEGLKLHLALENKSVAGEKVRESALWVCLLTRDPFSETGKPFGYYQCYVPRTSRGSWLRWALRKALPFIPPSLPKVLEIASRCVPVPWTAKELVEKGKGIRLADDRRAAEGPVIIEPAGSFRADLVVGEELLPPGEYEVFFYLAGSDFSSPAGPMSKRLRFDVVKRKDSAASKTAPARKDGEVSAKATEEPEEKVEERE